MELNRYILYFVALIPVLLFVAALLCMDSFSLIKKKILLAAFAWGWACTIIVGNLGGYLHAIMPIDLLTAPIFEELFKGLGILVILKMRRSVFRVDTLIYGAAIGAGFAFAENIFYIQMFQDMTIGTAVMRGAGTAIMHCGAVAGTGALLYWVQQRTGHMVRYYPLCLLPAITLHTIFNSLILPPIIAFMVVLIGVSVWIVALMLYNESSIGRWIETEMSSEVELLMAMRKGEFTKTHIGQYLLSIRESFDAEEFFDIWCYVQLYLELSITAKRNMMLAEIGMPTPEDDAIPEKVREFYALKKRISRVGLFTLAPIIKQDQLMMWKIESIK